VCCGVETGVDAEGEHYQRGGAREARPYLRADRLTQLVGQPLSPHLSMFLRCVHHFVAKRFFFLSRHSSKRLGRIDRGKDDRSGTIPNRGVGKEYRINKEYRSEELGINSEYSSE